MDMHWKDLTKIHLASFPAQVAGSLVRAVIGRGNQR
jgi:hypothetical protein